RRRARPRAVPRRRRGWCRRDLHRARACDSHHTNGDPPCRRDHRLPRAEAALMLADLSVRWIFALALAAAIAGCAIKPPPSALDLQRDTLSHTSVPSAWKATGATPAPIAERW